MTTILGASSSSLLPLRLALTGCLALGVSMAPILGCAGARNEASPMNKVIGAEVEPDRAAVADFFAEVKEETEQEQRRDPNAGYGLERGVFYLAESWCAQRLGLPEDTEIERCMVRDLANRSVAVLIVVSDCEAERCEAAYWILSDARGLRPSPVELDFELVVSPDLRHLYAGQMRRGPDGYTANLTRLELKTLKRHEVGDCAAPTLSPSGRWIVCRDVSGDVHRFSLPEGPLELIHEIDLGQDRIYSDAHGGVNLPAVRFMNEGRIRVVTLTHEGREDVEEVRWVETPARGAR